MLLVLFHCSSGPSAWIRTLLWPTRGWEPTTATWAKLPVPPRISRKAYELRERVSEREKFYIASHYENFVTGNLEAARKTYELWAQTYPRDDIPPGNLGVIYTNSAITIRPSLRHRSR